MSHNGWGHRCIGPFVLVAVILTAALLAACGGPAESEHEGDPIQSKLEAGDSSLTGPTGLPISATSPADWSWENPYPQVNPLLAIWGSSSTDVFAVGEAGTILHYDGHTWSTMISGTTSELNGVWGSSSTDVFAVGSSGTILHYDGEVWSNMTSGTTSGFTGVWGSSSTDVFTVGYGTTGMGIVHYDGKLWRNMTNSMTNTLLAVWGSSSSDVLVVGGEGTILRKKR